MGLPEIIVDFRSKASTVINRSERGIVAMILADETESITVVEYTKVSDVKDGWTEDNINLIKLAFMGNPNKVIVVKTSTSDPDYSAALELLRTRKFNYLAVPNAVDAEITNIADWIKDCRKTEHKIFKAVLANHEADNEGIINFTTDNIKTEDKLYSTQEYTSRIAGIMAGLSLDRSSTYFVLTDVLSIEEKPEPNTNIDNGELILINDGEKIKIARGVNSLKTIDEKSAEMKKIKIVEGMDLITEDIITSFNDNYVGKVINNYDNKQLFFASVNGYFLQLAKDNVLDKDFNNYAEIDIQEHIKLLQGQGKDISDMTEIQIKKLNTGSKVYATANVKFVDAMEDLQFIINM